VRVAALYDVHGNVSALEAVLLDVERENVDTIVCGGDVTWGPFQSECITLLRDVGARFVAGNCEHDVLHGDSERDAWCRERLTEADRAAIEAWPLTLQLDVGPLGSVLFCHATPQSNEAILTRITPDEDAVEALAGADSDVVVCGHVHVQYDRRLPGGPRLVNPGSVGLAYETMPAAYWALLDDDVELRRTEYDLDTAVAALVTSGFPEADDVFGVALRGEISPEEATAYFEAQRAAS
jgi:putative phosphoesterase